MCSKLDVREIEQLWYSARLYYNLLPKGIEDTEMRKTVGRWSAECEKTEDFHELPLFTFSCHLTSCAIRLYSIDEKRKHQRFIDYSEAWRKADKATEFFCSAHTDRIIHCVLRNNVAHHELKGEEMSGDFQHEKLNAYYRRLTFHELHLGMQGVVKSIQQDLKEVGIELASFAK